MWVIRGGVGVETVEQVEPLHTINHQLALPIRSHRIAPTPEKAWGSLGCRV